MSNYRPIKKYLIDGGFIGYLDLEAIKYIVMDCKITLPTEYYYYIQTRISPKWNIIASSYRWKGLYKKEIKIYDEILKSFPDDPETLMNFGNYLVRQKNYQNALGTFKRVLEVLNNSLDCDQKVFRTYKSVFKMTYYNGICEEIAYLNYLNENYCKALEFCNIAKIKFSFRRQLSYCHKRGILMKTINSYFIKFIGNPKFRFREYLNFKILKLHIRAYLNNES